MSQGLCMISKVKLMTVIEKYWNCQDSLTRQNLKETHLMIKFVYLKKRWLKRIKPLNNGSQRPTKLRERLKSSKENNKNTNVRFNNGRKKEKG